MTTLHTISSGSSGNAALVSREGTHVLVDAGISCRRITAALRVLALTPADLSAVLITHTHTDHISGLATAAKQWDVPIYASQDAAVSLMHSAAGVAAHLHPFFFGETLSVGACTVTPFPTAHDAPGATGYRLDDLGILTDTGYVTDAAADVLAGVSLLVLEANHDESMLRSGPYPAFLKRRILGTAGHLSNAAAAEFAVREARCGTRQFVLAHLSAENNTPALACGAVEAALRSAGCTASVCVAPRLEVSGCFSAREALCSG